MIHNSSHSCLTSSVCKILILLQVSNPIIISLLGALVFILVWLLFLFIWSIPLNLIQYGVGRYTKVCTVESFDRLIGPSYRWLGGFIVGVNLLIGSVCIHVVIHVMLLLVLAL